METIEQDKTQFKTYESRPDKEYTIEVCECGHRYLDHTNTLANMLKTLKSIPDKDGMVENRITTCEECMCPEYKKVCTMSWTEYHQSRKKSKSMLRKIFGF